MKTIYKYQLQIVDHQLVQIPKKATFLSVQFQENQLCMWLIVDTERMDLEAAHISIFGTGHELPDSVDSAKYWYLGTVQQFNGKLVWHIFEYQENA